ncbi:hypothetical protein ACIQU2_03375 [Pseudomonas sp. NPDC098740]|uniref:hypothetical protein n=1 Tax=Pseudomonas sp. NPDC098740 TaxID=3364486 RepID=UPI00383B0816
MSSRDMFIPQKKKIQAEGNQFLWHFNDPNTVAESTSFHKGYFPPTGEYSWGFSGSTGSGDEENFFSFLIMVPYLGEDVLEYTYKLGDGKDLHFSHTHSIPAPPGFTGFRVVDADDAELSIRLDPIKGTVQGDFNATFKTYRLNPNGTFKLKRDDQ